MARTSSENHADSWIGGGIRAACHGARRRGSERRSRWMGDTASGAEHQRGEHQRRAAAQRSSGVVERHDGTSEVGGRERGPVQRPAVKTTSSLREPATPAPGDRARRS